MTKKIILDIDDELWRNFKKSITRDKTLNQAVVELIEEKLKKNIDEKLEKMSFESGITLLREDLDLITIQLVKLIMERMVIIEKIGRLKKKFKKPIENKTRESEIMNHIKQLVMKENKKIGRELVDYRTAQEIMKLLISDAKKLLFKIKTGKHY